METDEAKKLYRARASLCELMNAHLRTHHGIGHFLVRGLAKITCVALLGAIASNLLQHAQVLLGHVDFDLDPPLDLDGDVDPDPTLDIAR